MKKQTNYSPQAKLPLEHVTATKLSHMRANEWIGTLDDGRRLYVLGSSGKLMIYVGEDLNAALEQAKRGKGHSVKSPVYSGRFVDTASMIKATGLKLSCEPKERNLDQPAGLSESK